MFSPLRVQGKAHVWDSDNDRDDVLALALENSGGKGLPRTVWVVHYRRHLGSCFSSGMPRGILGGQGWALKRGVGNSPQKSVGSEIMEPWV